MISLVGKGRIAVGFVSHRYFVLEEDALLGICVLSEVQAVFLEADGAKAFGIDLNGAVLQLSQSLINSSNFDNWFLCSDTLLILLELA